MTPRGRRKDLYDSEQDQQSENYRKQAADSKTDFVLALRPRKPDREFHFTADAAADLATAKNQIPRRIGTTTSQRAGDRVIANTLII
jgi:hypothetical protein